MHGGVGWEKMFDVYEYEDLEYEEVCRRYVRKSEPQFAPAVVQICGPEFTEKFSMWRICGEGRVSLPRNRAVAVVTGGGGLVNGINVKKGDRLLVADEESIETSGDVALIACA